MLRERGGRETGRSHVTADWRGVDEPELPREEHNRVDRSSRWTFPTELVHYDIT